MTEENFFTAPEVGVEMRRRYLERRESDLAKVRAEVAMNQWDAAQRLGHQLKGAAETFGFHELGAVGAVLEDAARSRSIADTNLAFHQLESELSSAGFRLSSENGASTPSS